MKEKKSISPEPKIIKELTSAVYPSFAMLAGMQLDVFTVLKEGSLTAQQIAQSINVEFIYLERLLYALVAARLLTMEGDSFSNTCEAGYFLVKDKPSYMGNDPFVSPLLNFYNWSAALKTAETIRTGIPQDKYDFSTTSEEDLEWIFRGTRPIAVKAGRELAAMYDFSSYRTLLDVGGASGGLAIAMTEAYPNLHATVVDLLSVTPITKHFVKEAGASDRVGIMTADVVHGSLSGSFDVAVLRALIHVLSPGQARHALKNIGEVINPGGAIFILGHILDDSRTSPLEEVGMNLVFLNIYIGAACHTEQEHRDWLIEAGFEQIERAMLPNGDGIMRAQKSTKGT